jgi:ribonuclease P protein component
MPARTRLRSSGEFAAVLRAGRRAGSRTVVVHALAPAAGASPTSPLVGFIVGRTVGGAVVRNRTRRRLRHLMRERLDRLPVACHVVVRALAPAGSASSVTLGSDLDRCLAQVTGPAR